MAITSIKSMIGQGLAAAGVLHTAVACLSLQHQLVPPTIRVLLNGQATEGTYNALIIGRPR